MYVNRFLGDKNRTVGDYLKKKNRLIFTRFKKKRLHINRTILRSSTENHDLLYT